MEIGEELVNSWLMQLGYFTMNEIKVGNKEIDILAIHPITGKRMHVEVTVPIRPVGGLRAQPPAKFGKAPLPERIKGVYQKKFVGKDQCVEKKVRQVFGMEQYEKMLVVGTLHVTDPKDELEKELAKYGVKLVLIKDILKDLIAQGFKHVCLDTPRRYLQIFAKNLLEEFD